MPPTVPLACTRQRFPYFLGAAAATFEDQWAVNTQVASSPQPPDVLGSPFFQQLVAVRYGTTDSHLSKGSPLLSAETVGAIHTLLTKQA